jgi:hypothetical protein
MQVVGRRYADADVLAASAAFEQVRPWQDTYRIPATRQVGWQSGRPLIMEGCTCASA